MRIPICLCFFVFALAACSGGGSAGIVNEPATCTKDEFTDDIHCGRPVITFLNTNVANGTQSFDANMLVVDTTSTSVELPATIVMTIALKSGSNQVQVQKSFKADLAGNNYVVAKPYELENWLIQNGSSSNRIEVYIPPLPIETIAGDNDFMFRLKYNGQQLGSSGQSWYQECGSENGGNPFEEC